MKSYPRIDLPPSSRQAYWFSRHWLLAFSIKYGLFVGLPFLAPVLMQIGWETSARAIYFYSFLARDQYRLRFHLLRSAF